MSHTPTRTSLSLDVHVVSHTHWDREWYQPQARFRQRLVALIDELLVDPPRSGESFLLDGQAILVEDYLTVRPECTEALTSLLSAGLIEAGPWLVLADELIPSGEALVRNLMAGHRVLARLGVQPPPVLYCPDSFGHPAALPAIAAGFGLELAIVWRGYGSTRWPRGDMAKWRAPSGESVVLFHLPRAGYEFGASLPTDSEDMETRWGEMRAELVSRSSLGLALVTNGADHHARQIDRQAALDALRRAARADKVLTSSLSAFSRTLLSRAGIQRLPVVQGELRDSYGYTWTLQGTLASRAAQKRRNAIVERTLLRESEPFAAMAMLAGAVSLNPMVKAAWRTLLESHPHDTLCGCSIDEVAAATDVRLSAAKSEAEGIRDDALAAILGHDPDASYGRRTSWQPRVVIGNSTPRPRTGVAFIDVLEHISDEPVGPGSRPPVATPMLEGRQLPFIEGSRAVQLLGQSIDRERLEHARHYPDNDIVARWRLAAWVDTVPAYAMTTHTIGYHPPKHAAIPNRVTATDTSIANSLVSVEVADGRVSITDLVRKTRIDDAIAIERATDRGDLYTPSIRDRRILSSSTRVEVVHRGPLVGELVLRFDVADAGFVEIAVKLLADSPIVRLDVTGSNDADDSRLRVGIASAIAAGDVWADAAFGSVQRVPLDIAATQSAAESVVPTAPLHRYVSTFGGDRGVTVFSDGLAEYESLPDGYTFITLVRGVGDLSRNDIPERPGHAGWPVETPAAQSRGPFEARIGFLSHGPRSATTVDQVERASDDFLLPLRGGTIRNAIGLPPSVSGIELSGAGLALSSIKETEDGGGIVLRCVNLLDVAQDGTWTLPYAVESVVRARLDETPTGDHPASGHKIPFRAGKREIVTLIAR